MMQINAFSWLTQPSKFSCTQLTSFCRNRTLQLNSLWDYYHTSIPSTRLSLWEFKSVVAEIWVKNPPLDAAGALGASTCSSKSSARNDKAGCELLRPIDAQIRPDVCLWGGRDERQSHQRLNSSSKREGAGLFLTLWCSFAHGTTHFLKLCVTEN